MKKALQSLAKYDFTPSIRNKGERYAAEGRVVDLRGNETSASATVQDSANYHVTANLKQDELHLKCSCDDYDSGELCKHLWAFLCAADEKGLLKEAVLQDAVIMSNSPDETFLPPPTLQPDWRLALNKIDASAYQLPPSRERQIEYYMDLQATLSSSGEGTLSATQAIKKKNGDWGKSTNLRISSRELHTLPDPLDRRIVGLLLGSNTAWSYMGGSQELAFLTVNNEIFNILLPDLCASRRFYLREDREGRTPVKGIDPNPEPWTLAIHVVESEKQDAFHTEARLQRGAESMTVREPQLLLNNGWLCHGGIFSRFDHRNLFHLAMMLRKEGVLRVPRTDGEEFALKLLKVAEASQIVMPPSLQVKATRLAPTPRIQLKVNNRERGLLHARYDFNYAGTYIKLRHPDSFIRKDGNEFILRDFALEMAATEQFRATGFKESAYYNRDENFPYDIPASRLSEAIRQLTRQGWRIEAEGKPYRHSGAINLSVSSGMDWFEVKGGAEFDGQFVALPDLLQALKNRESFIALGDGSIGMLPEQWLKRYGLIASLGEEEGDAIRFTKSQAGLLDALIATQPEITFDSEFARVRDELKNFQKVSALDPPPSFKGTLREYQREGLGWMHFLQRYNLGGCLADDMGLGKTVQVLAMLEYRRLERIQRKDRAQQPSLAVVPRSLMFNWMQEAARFTPELRVLEHSGIARAKSTGHLQDYDLILTTYGTLRRDVPFLKDVEFDYLVLDEAQAIKNADSLTAKATRLLRGTYKLVLSGTPVENHLGELWSLIEFLNPGLLGTSRAFDGLSRGDIDEDSHKLLAATLRPFILRRTKSQVAKDLPERQEETIYCELPEKQRKLYDQLLDHYRASLLGLIEEKGLNKSKIQILEALLRLRQAACHPGLLDKKKVPEDSAKIATLIPQLTEIAAEGHKALVFSQFVSFLDIVKAHLAETDIRYAYLDGKTRNRQEQVARFQKDPDCKLFLISLKAGGLGLNLTEAEYVFLLDPWWNPAVEAQAIDRAHRIGQKRNVFAYRLIAKDTIEEKVLELQKKKRALAEAIITADNSLIRTITREDLELLFG